MQQVLHVKQEDLRIYDATNEESPELLDDETKTVEDLGFKDGHKILVESMGNYLSTLSVCQSVYLSFCLFIILFVYLSVCLSIILSVFLSIYHSVCLPVLLSYCLSIILFVCLSYCLSIILFVCLSIYHSVSLTVYLSFCLSACLIVFSKFHSARSKDNTWPEELMAVMKEVQEQDQEKQKERSKSQGIETLLNLYTYELLIITSY